jgi:hypothetical protein
VLLLRDGREATIWNVEFYRESKKTYNFAVDDLHCYAVGGLAVLVHNGCGGTTSRPKSVNLPSWKKLTVDWGHIIPRHMPGGALTAGRTVFNGLTQPQVARLLKSAYSVAKKLSTQGDRILLRGQSGGRTVELWINTVTKMIETAYPIY